MPYVTTVESLKQRRLVRQHPVERFERQMVIEPVPVLKDKSDRFLKTLTITAGLLFLAWVGLGLLLVTL